VAGRYLITGVAGSGKSTLEKLFKKKDYITIDIDDGFTEWRHAKTDEVLAYSPDDEAWHKVAEWVVKTDKLQDFFARHRNEDVLVFGSFARMNEVVVLFDKLFLLEYLDEQIVYERIAHREGGYGKNPHELQRILGYLQPYQEKMKRAGAQPIDCTLPVDQVVEIIEKNLAIPYQKDGA